MSNISYLRVIPRSIFMIKMNEFGYLGPKRRWHSKPIKIVSSQNEARIFGRKSDATNCLRINKLEAKVVEFECYEKEFVNAWTTCSSISLPIDSISRNIHKI